MRSFFYFASITSLLIVMTMPTESDARRKKFKGVVIVNQILKLSGTITNNGEPAPEFSGVKEGDLLETGEKSSAVIRIPGLAIFRLGEKTKLKLTRFANRDRSKIQIFSGEVLCLYKRLGEHEITAPETVIIPEGGGALTFLVKVVGGTNPQDKTMDDIVLWDGKIHLKSLVAEPKSPALALKIPEKKAPDTKGPQLSAEKASDAPVGMNVAVTTPAAAAMAAESAKREILLITQKSVKQVLSGPDGLEEKAPDQSLLDLKAVQDLESLYALP